MIKSFYSLHLLCNVHGKSDSSIPLLATEFLPNSHVTVVYSGSNIGIGPLFSRYLLDSF